MIIKKLVELVAEIFGTWIEAKREDARGRLAIARTRAEAMATIDVAQATADIQWDLSQADASRYSWKDEFWTILLAVPVVMVFVPGLEPYVTQGFTALEILPDWYKAAVGIAIGAAFGHKKILDYMVQRKQNHDV
jgi:hypothetical protein